MRFHPLGYNVMEQYPGQHPAEAVLDHIMRKLADHTSNNATKVIEIEHVAQHYFDHKATLPDTPVYDQALAGPALNEMRKAAHELVCGLLPSADRHGWPISFEEARAQAVILDANMQHLWPDIK